MQIRFIVPMRAQNREGNVCVRPTSLTLFHLTHSRRAPESTGSVADFEHKQRQVSRTSTVAGTPTSVQTH